MHTCCSPPPPLPQPFSPHQAPLSTTHLPLQLAYVAAITPEYIYQWDPLIKQSCALHRSGQPAPMLEYAEVYAQFGIPGG